jgi:hypothetical protein
MSNQTTQQQQQQQQQIIIINNKNNKTNLRKEVLEIFAPISKVDFSRRHDAEPTEQSNIFPLLSPEQQQQQ